MEPEQDVQEVPEDSPLAKFLMEHGEEESPGVYRVKKTSPAAAMALGAVHGLSAGLSPYTQGVTEAGKELVGMDRDSPLARLTRMIGGSGEGFSKEDIPAAWEKMKAGFSRGVDTQKAAEAQAKQDRPGDYLGGDIAGNLGLAAVTGPASLAKSAPAAVGKAAIGKLVGRGVLQGGIPSAIRGAAESEAPDLEGKLKDAAIPGAIGGALGGLGGAGTAMALGARAPTLATEAAAMPARPAAARAAKAAATGTADTAQSLRDLIGSLGFGDVAQAGKGVVGGALPSIAETMLGGMGMPSVAHLGSAAYAAGKLAPLGAKAGMAGLGLLPGAAEGLPVAGRAAATEGAAAGNDMLSGRKAFQAGISHIAQMGPSFDHPALAPYAPLLQQALAKPDGQQALTAAVYALAQYDPGFQKALHELNNEPNAPAK